MLDNPGTDFIAYILINQLRGVFRAIIRAGADIKQADEKNESAEQSYSSFKLDRYELW